MVKQPMRLTDHSDGPIGLILTDEDGLYNTTGAPTQVTDSNNFYSLTSTGNETLYFYTDYNGECNFRLININVKASASVALTVKWYWFVNGTWGEKYAYSMSLTGTQALQGVNTAYPFFEDIPPGTISRIAITTASAVTVSVNAMVRYY